jgi:divalent metal cation (Fe/Co/Zn/Cd) transporter
LLAAKLLSWPFTGSVSVLSKVVNSATDLVASLVALVAVRRSGPPPENHNYGHRRLENLAGSFEGFVLLGVAGWISYWAVDSILHGVDLELVWFWGLG